MQFNELPMVQYIKYEEKRTITEIKQITNVGSDCKIQY